MDLISKLSYSEGGSLTVVGNSNGDEWLKSLHDLVDCELHIAVEGEVRIIHNLVVVVEVPPDFLDPAVALVLLFVLAFGEADVEDHLVLG